MNASYHPTQPMYSMKTTIETHGASQKVTVRTGEIASQFAADSYMSAATSIALLQHRVASLRDGLIASGLTHEQLDEWESEQRSCPR